MTKLLADTNSKLKYVVICLILSTTIAMLSFSTATLLGLYSIWKMQVILFALLVVLYSLKAEKLYAVIVGACYLAPIVSYVYFYIASGPLLVLSSLGVICAVFAINYFVMNNIQLNDYSCIKNELIAKYGKVVILSSVVIIVAVAALYFLIPLVPIMPLIYTALITWYASLLLILRAGYWIYLIVNDDSVNDSSIFALSLFADPVNFLAQIIQMFSFNSKTNNSKTSFSVFRTSLLIIASLLIMLYAVVNFIVYNPKNPPESDKSSPSNPARTPPPSPAKALPASPVKVNSNLARTPPPSPVHTPVANSSAVRRRSCPSAVKTTPGVVLRLPTYNANCGENNPSGVFSDMKNPKEINVSSLPVTTARLCDLGL